MQFDIRADLVELRSEPKPDGTLVRRSGVTPAEMYRVTAETDEERILIRPLFHEFAAKILDTLAAAGLVHEDAQGAAQACRDAAEADRKIARVLLTVLAKASPDADRQA
ncbi:hypothetical protein [Lentzea cavernae]|uniref:Mycofactocin binding protein MftB n=1 Tax=Lentzea cavernae TaxID=2020703 RepID=A0ABQ3MU63_9PSEU|nr:hypothetical protein [Lentzea cavernae]GHH57816.1 hypothetical protein GCM10017774_78150 [Lentzea cavernae]